MGPNIKLLSNEQRVKLSQIYNFELKDDTIIVTTKNYSRKTAHSCNESFSINSPIRKITITPDAIQMWSKLNFEYHLINIQQIVNYLAITYQDINVDNVKNFLRDEILQKIGK